MGIFQGLDVPGQSYNGKKIINKFPGQSYNGKKIINKFLDQQGSPVLRNLWPTSSEN
jgi:hypothetical protein